MDGSLPPNENGAVPPSDLTEAGSVDGVVATCPAMELEIGIFFDGTGNNSGNVRSGILARARGEPDEGGSFAADYSNVEKLSRVYQNAEIPSDCGGIAKKTVSEYVEGIGTETGQSDSTIGFALGWGVTGVERRVADTFLKFLRHVNNAKVRGELREVKVDVFGFSRGAASARHFVNCVHRGHAGHGYGGSAYEVQAEDKPKIKIRFLGMFDCVVSVGTVADDDNHGSLRIGLLDNSAEKIVHITAEDEFRENFSLTMAPSGAEQIRLPGAHSDIGGGYARHFEEDIHIRPIVRRHDNFNPRPTSEAEIAAEILPDPEDQVIIADLLAKGWISPGDTNAYHKELDMVGSGRYDPYFVTTKLTRPWVKHDLSRVALNVMHQRAVDAGVPFPARLPAVPDFQVPQNLGGAYRLALAGSRIPEPMHKWLRREYVHHSSHWALSAIFYPMKPQTNNQRREWPNPSGEAIGPNY